MLPSASPFPDDVDVAVVSHNGLATLPRLIQCLTRAAVPLDRVRVYDIASTDGMADWLATTWPSVRIIPLDVNDGPNPARNRALADSRRPYLLLLDADAYVAPGTAHALLAAIKELPDIGAAVPVVVHDDRPDTIQYAGGRLHFVCEAINPWHERPLVDRGYDSRACGTAPGVCLLLDVARAAAIGGFDEAYFLGKDDGEFCYRLRVAGWQIREVPGAVVRHASRPRSTWLLPFQIRNRWHFILKNYELRTLLALAPALLVHEVAQLALLLVKGEGRAWWTALRRIGPMCATLPQQRSGVASVRRVPDTSLLDAAPFLVRADFAGGRLGGLAKWLYDRWLGAYWHLVCRVLR